MLPQFFKAKQSDFAKLSSLSAGGRSTATTILSLSAITKLKESTSKVQSPVLNAEVKKVLLTNFIGSSV